MGKYKKLILGLLTAFSGIAASAVFFTVNALPVSADVPLRIGYQGRLKNSSSTALTGSYDFTFRLYDDASAGNLEWSETQTNVTVTNGYFAVTLGSSTAFPDTLDFSETYYISTEVESDGEMSPRSILTSSPYAFRAGGLETAASDPVTNLRPGRMYFNTGNNTLYVYSGGAWVSTSSGGGAPSDATYLVTSSDGTLSDEVVTSSLAANLTFQGDDTAARTITLGQTNSFNDLLVIDTGNFLLDSSGNVTTYGNFLIGNAVTDNLTISSAIQGTSALIFDGSTDDTIETIFSITNPTTSDKTITFPDASGTVILSGHTFTSDVTATLDTDGSTALTIAANSVALGTDTTNDYVASITNGSGISGGNGGSESAALTLSLGALTGDWNQTGAFDIVLNNADSQIQILESDGGSSIGTIDVGALSGDATYTFAGATGTVLTSGNYTTTLDSVYVNVGESPTAGDISGSFTAGLTIEANSVALGTDTTNNYVTSITNGSGISGGDGGSESAALTLSLGALTGDWDQTGAFDIVLNNADSQIQILESDGGASIGTIDVGALSGNATYTFAGATGTVLTTGNYTGTLDSVYVNVGESPAAGDISGSFTAGLTIEANSVALGTDTTNNYVASTNTSILTGLTGGSTGSEGAALTLAFDYSQVLSGNVGLGADATVFGVSGLIAEGSAADNIELFLSFTNPTTSDKTITFPDASGTLILSGHTFSSDVTGTLDTDGDTALTIANNSVDGTDIALGSDAQGDIMYYDGTDWVRLAKGSAGQVLEMNAGATAPEWDTDDTGSGGAFASAGGIIDKSTEGDRLRLLYGDAADTQLTIENTTNSTIPSADSVVIDLSGGTTGIVTNGVDGLYIAAEFGNGTTNTNSGIHLNIDPVDTPDGDEFFNGILIDAIAGTDAAERAISIGDGWDSSIFFSSSSPNITIANGGTLSFKDSAANLLLSIADSGAVSTVTLTGSLQVTGDVTFGPNPTNINFTGSSHDLNIVDDISSAITISEGTNDYLNITTTNASENVSFGNTTTNPTFSFLGSGTTTFSGSVALGSNTLSGTTAIIDFTDFDVSADGLVTFASDGAGDQINATSANADYQVLVVNSEATDITNTSGLIDLNVDAGDAAVDVINIDLEGANGIAAATDITGLEMLITGSDADADFFGQTITFANTGAAIAGTYEAGIFIDNADATSASLNDGILITSSGASGGVVDGLDVSAANITNAVNIGDNTLLGTTAVIDFTDFDIDADGLITLASDGAGDQINATSANADYQFLVVNSEATDVTNTAGLIELNLDAGNAAVDGINVDIEAAGAITAGTDITALEILLTATDTDADMFGITMDTHATAGVAGSYEAGIKINNSDDTAGSMPDAIIITSSGVNNGVTDAIDASAANIDNAINVGANDIEGTTATITFTDFTVDADGLVTFASDGAGDQITATAGNADYQVLVVDAATTDITNTAGLIDLNIDAGNAAVDGINIDIEAAGSITAATDITALEILLTATDTDADLFGITIDTHATAGIANSYEAGIKINNSDDTAGSMPDGIIITATTDTATTDGIDVSDAEIVNAINVGANTILGTNAAIDFTEFDVSATTGAITINDGGDAGNISIEGTVLDIDSLDFVTGGTFTVAGSSDFYFNVDTDSMVGIGISSPTSLLHVGALATAGGTNGTDAVDALSIAGTVGGTNNGTTNGLTGGTGGDILILTGTGGTATGATADAATVSGGRGGNLTITLGDGGAKTGDPAGAGANSTYNMGGVGGGLAFTAGTGGAASGATGNREFAVGGVGGAISFIAGTGGSSTATSAGSAGDASGGFFGNGGALTLAGGTGGASSAAASPGSTSSAGKGGSVTIYGGNGGAATGGFPSGTTGTGGNVFIYGGFDGTGAVSGKVYLGTNDGSTSKSSVFVNLRNASSANAVCHTSSGTGVAEELLDCDSTPSADYMEIYPVAAGTQVGDVLSLGSTNVVTNDGDTIKQLVPSTSAYDSKFIGIASNPANISDFNSIGHNIPDSKNPYPIALSGRVKVKISSSSDDIQSGDLLTTSLQTGRAMKATQPGQVIGKALESWSAAHPTDTIMVFVTTSYYDANSSSARYKTNIGGLTFGLTDLMKLRPVMFDWKNTGKTDIGFIAEEVNAVNPMLAFLNSAGSVEGVRYKMMSVLLTKAVQEQQLQIEALAGKLGLALNLSTAVNEMTVRTPEFTGNISVKRSESFGVDSIGQAKFLRGAQEVKVIFEIPYQYQPVVTVTPTAFIRGAYKVDKVTAKGFTINLEFEQQEDVTFNWHSFGANGGKVFVSDNTKQDITLVVEEAPTVPNVNIVVTPVTTTPPPSTGWEDSSSEDITTPTGQPSVEDTNLVVVDAPPAGDSDEE